MALDILVYRGAAPLHGDEFLFLAKLGVKTVVSVDRAQPDRAAADSAGLRYVHIPIGYGKMERAAQLDFLKALEMLPGPFYVHCHAGKYRVGAMSAVYRVARSGWSNEGALKEMLALGGKDVYQALNHSVLAFKPPSPEELASHAYDPDRPREVPKVAEHMGAISHLYQEMEKFIDGGRDSLEMDAISLAMEERFWEIDRLRLCEACDSSDYSAMRGAARHSQEMRLLRDYSQDRLKTIAKDCRACHLKMRDVPDNVETALKMKLNKLMLDFE